MFDFGKSERIFISGIIIGSLIGSISAALAYFINTQAVIKSSVKNNLDKEKIEPVTETPAAEEKPKRTTRRKKTEKVETGNAVTE